MGKIMIGNISVELIASVILIVIAFFFRDSLVKFGNKIRFWFNNSLPGNLKPKFIDIYSQTLTNIRNKKTKIKTLNQLQRYEVEEIRISWAGGVNGLLLVGEAGTGKSGIAAILAGELLKEKHFVMLLNADEVTEPVENFRKDYYQGQSIFEYIRQLADFGYECYIIIDQLDSVQRSEQLKGLVNIITELSRLPKVRVLGVSRTYEANNLPEIKNPQFKEIYSDSLSAEDSTKYLIRLGIENPNEELNEVSKNLLNLSLIAEVVSLGADVKELKGEFELWELNLHSIREREGGEALSLLSNLAILEAENKTINFSFDQEYLSGQHRRLKSRQLLLSIGGGKYKFFHRKFRDFLCAKKLLSENYRSSTFLDQFGYINGTSIINWILELYRKDGPDVENSFIRKAIDDEELPFYVKASIFDSYLSKEKSELDEQIVNQILLVRQYQRLFFENLDDPKWVKYLYELGLFSNVPEPVEDFQNPGDLTPENRSSSYDS